MTTHDPYDGFAAEPWMTDGLCAQVDPDLWFPEKGGNSIAAKRICVKCPVRDACLDYALTHNVDGIWSGTSNNERARIKANRVNREKRPAA